MKRRRLRMILILLAGLAIVLTAADSIMAWYASFQVDEIQEMARRYGWWARLLFLGLATIRPIAFIPVSFFFFTGGILFGTALGSFLAITGLMIASSICYWMAHRFQGLFHRIAQEKYIRKVQDAAASNLVAKIFSLRASPGVPFDMISYASGLANISFRKFILGTFLGTIPRGVLYTYLGDNLNNYLSPATVTVYTLLLTLALGPHVYKWIQKKRDPEKCAARHTVKQPPWQPPDC